jgi:hypothetical protein
MDNTEMDINVSFRRTQKGYLATVRVVTRFNIIFHRMQLGPDAPIWEMHDGIVGGAMKALRARYGSGHEAPRMVSMQTCSPGE